MTVSVVGSRRIAGGIAQVLDELVAPSWACVISGGAVGVDQQAVAWARTRGLLVVEHLPDYKAHGRHATHVRNRTIVDGCDLLVAFWDDDPWPEHAQGMVKRARRRGVPVVRVIRGRVDEVLGSEPSIPHGLTTNAQAIWQQAVTHLRADGLLPTLKPAEKPDLAPVSPIAALMKTRERTA